MGTMAEMQDINMRSMPKKGMAAPELKRLEHERSSNGGHVFTHMMHQGNGAYMEPEVHTFGADEGKAALEHFAKHAGIENHLASTEQHEEESGNDAGEEEAAGAAE